MLKRKGGGKLHHVKPHGALYNQSANNGELAKAIAQAVYDFDSTLTLYGLSASESVRAVEAIGLKAANEVFADRTYQNDGTLTPRSQENSVIENAEQAINQVLMMVDEGKVISVTGQRISVPSDTICIHGDGKNALQFANDGQPIVLLADRQTVDGYPKVANIISADISKFVQLSPDSNVRFQCVEIDEAHEILLKLHYESQRLLMRVHALIMDR